MAVWVILLSIVLMPIATGMIAEKRGRDFFGCAILEILLCAIAITVILIGQQSVGAVAWVSAAAFELSLPALLFYLPEPSKTDKLTLEMPIPPQDTASPKG